MYICRIKIKQLTKTLTTMKNLNQNLENVANVSKSFAGYGHNRLTVSFNDGSQLSAITSNTRMTDSLDSDNDTEAEQAIIDCATMVLNSHN